MKNLLYIFSFVLATTAIAQTTNTLELEQQRLRQALNYGDKAVAAISMYNIIALEGPQSSYKDSLAYLYFNNRNYLSCFLVSKDVLEKNPDNIEILEMNIISLESIGAKAKAIEGYNKLSLLNPPKSAYFAARIKEIEQL